MGVSSLCLGKRSVSLMNVCGPNEMDTTFFARGIVSTSIMT